MNMKMLGAKVDTNLQDTAETYETNIDENETLKIRKKSADEDSVYDCIEVGETNYRAEKKKKRSCMDKNSKLALVSLILICTVVCTVLITRSLVKPRCDTGWREIGGETCMQFFPASCEDGCSFSKAQQICKLKKGKLAEPRNEKVLKDIVEFGKDSKKLSARNFWIGLEFDTKRQQFQWLSDRSQATLDNKYWNKGNPSYEGAHVHLKQGNMLLNDVAEGQFYKPVCQRRNKDNCDGEWKSPGSQSAFCYNFMERECIEGCDFIEAQEVCEKYKAFLAEGPDFDFLSKFAKLLKTDVNWRIGISYNKSADIFVRASDETEIDLSDVYTKSEGKETADTGSGYHSSDPGWYPDIDYVYEYEYPYDLLDVFEDKNSKKEETANFCMDLSSSNSWKIHEGECHRKQSKNLNIQPLCEQ